jgi:cytochrome c oxidase subunit 2
MTQAQVAPRTSWAWGIAIYFVAMLAIACGLFWLGYVPFLDAAVAPADAYEIQVTSQKGAWSFSYPSGKVSDNRLVVPRWRPVRLVMSSKDTMHNLYLPQFRLQQTAIPGRYTSIWFEATEARTMPIQCVEDCPSEGLAPGATLSIVEPDKFEQWLALSDKSKRSSTGLGNRAKP